jgi:hypothetical protein
MVLPLLLVSCRDAQVATYRIPKEKDTPPAAPASAPAAMGAATGGLAVAATDKGGLTWTAPAAWRSKPASSMRKGSFDIGPEGGPAAELAITAFPGDVGGDLANVNRWLGQLGRPPIADAELAAVLRPVSGAGVAMQVVDLAGGTAEAPLRMLGAIVPHEGSTWFFKLTGPDAVVAPEKGAFLEFLKTVKVSAQPPAAPAAPAQTPAPPESAVPPTPPPAGMAGTPVVRTTGPSLKWTAPAHWQNRPASSMRKATFVVTDAGGAEAELAVTAFPGDVGGELANLNRWRGQLALPPIAAGELEGALNRLTVNGLPVVIVDITGGTADKPLRLLGAMVPFGGSTWFFKLTGPAALVGAEKPAFLAFVQTISAP